MILGFFFPNDPWGWKDSQKSEVSSGGLMCVIPSSRWFGELNRSRLNSDRAVEGLEVNHPSQQVLAVPDSIKTTFYALH